MLRTTKQSPLLSIVSYFVPRGQISPRVSDEARDPLAKKARHGVFSTMLGGGGGAGGVPWGGRGEEWANTDVRLKCQRGAVEGPGSQRESGAPTSVGGEERR